MNFLRKSRDSYIDLYFKADLNFLAIHLNWSKPDMVGRCGKTKSQRLRLYSKPELDGLSCCGAGADLKTS